GGKTTTNTQSSLTNKALLIKYFVVSSIAKSFCLLSHYYPDMPMTVGEETKPQGQELENKCSRLKRLPMLSEAKSLSFAHLRQKVLP
ncbi:MAG TPA: hypothetical protein VMW72_07870, partial [Sedimentisphaerales bacterium]|nr:hypothetical protein [Sedimentisphaerales bacterium]